MPYSMHKMRIGFIGQGWIGKNYADDFERRGYEVVRYSLEPAYLGNKDSIGTSDVVFIAVPTPTTEQGFDASIVSEALSLVGEGKIAVIKSTLLPGTTETLQDAYPKIVVLCSPEFLREASAAEDAAHPARNLIGIPRDTETHKKAAATVLALLPPAPYVRVMSARAAELTKYAGNVFLALKVVFANVLYDLSDNLGVAYQEVQEALAADTRIGPSHLSPVNASGHSSTPGRGAGGHCFIKDLEAFRQVYVACMDDEKGIDFLNALVRKNTELLRMSNKDLDLLEGVYGSIRDISV